MIRRVLVLLALSSAVAASACTYDPKYDANGIKCSANGDCPSGYHCAKVSGAVAGMCSNKQELWQVAPKAEGNPFIGLTQLDETRVVVAEHGSPNHVRALRAVDGGEDWAISIPAAGLGAVVSVPRLDDTGSPGLLVAYCSQGSQTDTCSLRLMRADGSTVWDQVVAPGMSTPSLLGETIVVGYIRFANVDEPQVPTHFDSLPDASFILPENGGAPNHCRGEVAWVDLPSGNITSRTPVENPHYCNCSATPYPVASPVFGAAWVGQHFCDDVAGGRMLAAMQDDGSSVAAFSASGSCGDADDTSLLLGGTTGLFAVAMPSTVVWSADPAHASAYWENCSTLENRRFAIASGSLDSYGLVPWTAAARLSPAGAVDWEYADSGDTGLYGFWPDTQGGGIVSEGPVSQSGMTIPDRVTRLGPGGTPEWTWMISDSLAGPVYSAVSVDGYAVVVLTEGKVFGLAP